MKLLKRTLASLLRIAAGVPIVGLLLAGLLLLLLGATWKGRCVGCSFVVLGAVLFCSVGYWRRAWFRRIRRRFYATLVPLGLLLYVVPLLLAPNGRPSGGPLQNRFLHGQWHFHRWSPANVIPEIDQLTVGMNLLSLGVVPRAEAARMRSLVKPIYAEMDRARIAASSARRWALCIEIWPIYRSARATITSICRRSPRASGFPV